MGLSVVIVNWNARQDLEACLRSLADQSLGGLETIVVDNGSTDDSAAMVRQQFPTVRLLDTGRNLGFAAGCNRGIAVSHGDWVCMLNNDTVADEHWARAMDRAARHASARCGMLQSLLLFQDRPETINSAGIELNPDGGGSDRLGGLDRQQATAAADIFCATAGAAAYRRTMLEAVKFGDDYFDSRHFMYFEDMDLGWRARLAGWTAHYVPDARVFHRWHGSSDRHGRAWLVTTAATNRFRTLLKNSSWRFLWQARGGCWSELRALWGHGGPRAMGNLLSASYFALKDRRRVERIRTVSRRWVERRWARQA